MIDGVTSVRSDLVLICIDVQQDFVPASDEDGTEPAAIRAIRRLVDGARAAEVPVVFIRELHNPSLIDLGREVDGAEGLHCLEGSAGANFIEGFGPTADEYQVRKRRYSAFFGTDLDIILRGYGARTVLLTGGLTDVCVHYTAVDAHQHDYHVRVVADAVFGSSADAHNAALDAIQYLQLDAITDTEATEELFIRRRRSSSS